MGDEEIIRFISLRVLLKNHLTVKQLKSLKSCDTQRVCRSDVLDKELRLVFDLEGYLK